MMGSTTVAAVEDKEDATVVEEVEVERVEATQLEDMLHEAAAEMAADATAQDAVKVADEEDKEQEMSPMTTHNS
jgi:hypothetical protein